MEFIQREFGVGNHTADRLMERMEEEGVVGPPPVVDWSREVLVGHE